MDTPILSLLRDHYREETTVPGIIPIDKSLVLNSKDRMRKLANLAIAEPDNRETHTEEYEAITETLKDIQKVREEKIITHACYPEILIPSTCLQPHETKLYTDIKLAVMVYRGACR